MGFGYVFVGYLIGMNFVYDGFTEVFSALLLLQGLLLLAEFNTSFRRARNLAFVLVGVGVLRFAVELVGLLQLWSVWGVTEATSSALYTVGSVLYEMLFFAFTWLLLDGIRLIAIETDIPVIRARSFRNQIYLFLYYPLILVAALPLLTRFPVFYAYFCLFLLLFGLVVQALNAKLLYSCYMWICLEDDLQMERKPSRFAFMNRINEHLDRRSATLSEQKKQQWLADVEAKRKKNDRKK